MRKEYKTITNNLGDNFLNPCIQDTLSSRARLAAECARELRYLAYNLNTNPNLCLYTTYTIVARALGLTAFTHSAFGPSARVSRGILYTTLVYNIPYCHARSLLTAFGPSARLSSKGILPRQP